MGTVTEGGCPGIDGKIVKASGLKAPRMALPYHHHVVIVNNEW